MLPRISTGGIMRFSQSFKIKISLFLIVCFFLTYSLPVKAAVFPDVNDIIAEWDANISTSFRDVYNEYKSLAPADRETCDKVIAANAYRFLISIGSNVLDLTVINEQRFADFMRAVSPFNMAFNNIVAEYLIESAWAISGDQYKIFCANVVHNIASNSEYYNSHVIKNDPFIDEAGQGSIQFSYNDIDNNTSVSVYNNIFLGNVLTSSGGSISVWFNPTPSRYTGVDITWPKFSNYLVNRPADSQSFCVFSQGIIGGSDYSSNLYTYNHVYRYYPSWELSDDSSVYFKVNIYSDGSGVISLPSSVNSSNAPTFYSFSLSNYYSPSYSLYNYNYWSFSSNFSFSTLSNLKSIVYDFFNSLSSSIVYCESITVFLSNNGVISTLHYPVPGNFSFTSPQFQPVNIYDNRVYSSSEDTYWHVDQMIDNINNYDYSTNNNGTNNTFYIDNYYITEPVSTGGVQLVTSSSITYQYITINNISTGPAIGSGPYDVRIINPEDITSEIITNNNSEILNDYNFNLGDLNVGVSIGSGLSEVSNNLDPVVTTGSSILANFVSGIPPDIATVVFSMLALSLIAGIFYRVTSG